MTIGSVFTNLIPSYAASSAILPAQTPTDASPTGATSRDDVGTADTFQSDFATMLQAVQAGNMNTAQSALTSLQGDVQSAAGYLTYSSYSPASSAPSATTASTPQTDLNALFQAVKTGDVTSAQAALAKLQSDAQSAFGAPNGSAGHAGGHHHHHHGGGGLVSALSQAFQSIDTTNGSATAGSNSSSSNSIASN